MTSLPAMRYGALTLSCVAIFVVGFLISIHFLPGGQTFAILFTVPLILIAWRWGQRAGFLSALMGIVFIRLAFSLEYLLLRHHGLDAVWIMSALETSLAYLVIAVAVGKLSDSLRALKRTVHERELAEKAAHDAEKRYRDLIEMAPQAICVVRDSRLVLINRGMVRSVARSEESLKGLPFASLFHPEDHQASLELMRNALEGNGREEAATLRMLGAGGAARWLEVRAREMAWEGMPAVLCFAMDVTPQKCAELALLDSHAHLEAVLNAVPDLLFEVDRDGRFYGLPTPHRERLVAPPEVFVGRTMKDILPPDAAAVGMGALSKAVKSGKHTGETYSVLFDGEERWFEPSISAIGDHRSPDAHFIVVARDITERRRLEEQVAQAKKMEAVGRLAGGIAHDFNNILQAIIGFCDLIRHRIGDEREVLRSVGVINDAAQRAASLTRQLLAFSRKQMIQPVVRDLNDFLRNAEEALRNCLGREIELVLGTGDQPIWVNVDPSQLQQVILNLAANARDSMSGRGRLWIEGHAARIGPEAQGMPADMGPGDYALITMRDTGIGMDRVTMSHIFEPFFTTKDVGQGSGLGLSIVDGIIRQLGGFVIVESTVGLGTSVSVYLPLIGEPAGPSVPLMDIPLPPE